jgi:hypothetical protein
MAGTSGSDHDPKKPGYALPQTVLAPLAPATASKIREVRPSLGGRSGTQVRTVAGAWGTAVAFVLIALPVVSAISGPIWLWVIDIPVALAAAGVGALALLYFRNQRVGLAGGFLYRVSTFGRRRQWPRGDLTNVVRVQAITGTGLSDEEIDLPTAVILEADLVIDKRGRAVESFTAAWPQEALTNLWQAAALPIRKPWSKPVDVQEIRHRYPGAVPTLAEPDDSSPRAVARRWILVVGTMVGCAVLAFVVFWIAVIITALRNTSGP